MLAVFCLWVFQFYFVEAALGRPAHFPTDPRVPPPLPPPLICGLLDGDWLSLSLSLTDFHMATSPFFLSFPSEPLSDMELTSLGWDAVPEGGLLGHTRLEEGPLLADEAPQHFDTWASVLAQHEKVKLWQRTWKGVHRCLSRPHNTATF